jgi:hypothetical protein
MEGFLLFIDEQAVWMESSAGLFEEVRWRVKRELG